MRYPETKRSNQIDEYFGVQVADPYRWLEDDHSSETAEWVKAQNALTFKYLDEIPFRGALKAKLTELADYERYGLPFKRNGRYYFFKNSGLQNHDVLYTQNTLDSTPQVFLDPNEFSEDGTIALSDNSETGGVSFSNNGKYVAYAISRSGSDWEEFAVIDLKTEELLPDHILWSKATGISWQGNGFYYSAYDAPIESGSELTDVNENQRIYYHKIGDQQADDLLIYQNEAHPKRFCWAEVDSDERALFIMESGEGLGNNLQVRNLTVRDNTLTMMSNNMDNTYEVIGVDGDRIFILTNDSAPNFKVMEASLRNPEQNYWLELIPESHSAINSAKFAGGRLIIDYLQDASSYVYCYDLNGNKLNEIELPALGSVQISGQKHDSEVFFLFESFTFPKTTYRYDMSSDQPELTLVRAPKLGFNPNDFVSDQKFFESADGTRVPMFLTYKKGLQLNGGNPTIIYGYGGFGISLTPEFSTSPIPFLDNGGIWVEVNLRGGGEYGENWHIDGTKMQKQNSFNDFIAAAEYLIENNYTNPQKLAMMGGSNGGLLVGAVMNQRPDLFKVAIPDVGVMDMLRYHKFTIGWSWASDYGTSDDDEEMFNYLKGYSPLHTVKPGTRYPATLILTADHDDRVVPAHSFKYAAALQAANGGNNPTLIRIDTDSGHGDDKPMSKVIDEKTDIYSFIFQNLGFSYRRGNELSEI